MVTIVNKYHSSFKYGLSSLVEDVRGKILFDSSPCIKTRMS